MRLQYQAHATGLSCYFMPQWHVRYTQEWVSMYNNYVKSGCVRKKEVSGITVSMVHILSIIWGILLSFLPLETDLIKTILSTEFSVLVFCPKRTVHMTLNISRHTQSLLKKTNRMKMLNNHWKEAFITGARLQNYPWKTLGQLAQKIRICKMSAWIPTELLKIETT